MASNSNDNKNIIKYHSNKNKMKYHSNDNKNKIKIVMIIVITKMIISIIHIIILTIVSI